MTNVFLFARIIFAMGEITLQQTLAEFKTIYMPARNLATRTREEYSNDLKAFIDFFEKPGVSRAGEISTFYIDRYLAKLDELGYSGSTRKRTLDEDPQSKNSPREGSLL